MLAELPTGRHEFRVVFVSADDQPGAAAHVSFNLEPVQDLQPIAEPKVFIEPAVQPPDMLRFNINIEDFDMATGRALVTLNETPAAVLEEKMSSIVLKDLQQGSKHLLQVRLISASGELLDCGSQAEFVMPVLNMAPEPQINIETPCASADGKAVQLKFNVSNYDFTQPAHVSINKQLAAVVSVADCTLCLADMEEGKHQVDITIPNTSFAASTEFAVVKPQSIRLPNIVLLQPAQYRSDKLLLRFELDAPLPEGMTTHASINGKLAAVFLHTHQSGCIVVDKPLPGSHVFKVEIPQIQRSEELCVVLA